MGDISSLESLARVHIGNCPKLLITRELLRASREFFEESQVWQETYYVGVPGGVSEGQFNIKDGQAMLAVIDVKKMGEKRSLLKAPSRLDLSRSSGEPQAYSSTTSKLFLGPIPTEDFIAEVLIAVKPSLSATTLPDQLIEDWGEKIASGAVESLLNMPETNWYSPKASVGHGNLFRSGITRARTRIARGFSNASPRASGGKFI